MIRVGQIGIGHNHGSAKMEAVRKFPELFEVVGICEDDPAIWAERGAFPAYKGLKRMSEQALLEQCDLILVESSVPDLTSTALRCVQAGKHIHMDKPGSGTLEEFGTLLRLAKEKKRIVQMGYMYRYNPCVQKAVELAKSGALGQLTMINAEMSTCHSLIYKQWLAGFRGGSMYVFGSHLVDIIVSLLGEPDKITAFLHHTGFDGVDFADNTLAVLEYGSCVARIFVSSVEVNGWGRRQLVLSGQEGTVDIKPIENTSYMTYSDKTVALHAYEDEKIVLPIEDIPKNCRYDVMVQDLYAYITGEKENPYTYAHEYTVQKVLSEICRQDRHLSNIAGI